MKVAACLSWYDENPNWLAATVTSLADACDTVIAVDGAYFGFPGGLLRPASGPEQVEAITATSNAAGLEVLVHQPTEPWAGQVEKRTYICRLAELVEADWLVVIDADETLVANDLRKDLVNSIDDVLSVLVLESEAVAGYSTRTPHHRLFRNIGLRYERNHSRIVDSDGRVLSGRGAVPAGESSALIEHRGRAGRYSDREQRRRDYYQMRQEQGWETP